MKLSMEEFTFIQFDVIKGSQIPIITPCLALHAEPFWVEPGH